MIRLYVEVGKYTLPLIKRREPKLRRGSWAAVPGPGDGDGAVAEAVGKQK
jgi:hypothetical protein